MSISLPDLKLPLSNIVRTLIFRIHFTFIYKKEKEIKTYSMHIIDINKYRSFLLIFTVEIAHPSFDSDKSSSRKYAVGRKLLYDITGAGSKNFINGT